MHAYTPVLLTIPMPPPAPLRFHGGLEGDHLVVTAAPMVGTRTLPTPASATAPRKRKETLPAAAAHVKRQRPRDRACGQFRHEFVGCQERITKIADGLTHQLAELIKMNEYQAAGRKFPGPAVRAAPGAPVHVHDYASRQYPDGSASVFYSLVAPAVSLKDYVHRLVEHIPASRAVFTAALVLLDRAHGADDALAICTLNVHRLVATAVAVANKALEDDPLRNSRMARIAGIPSTAEMNLLERHFLERLEWDTSIDVEAFYLYDRSLFGEM